MIIEAWQCERCGRLHPAEYVDVLPKGWLLVGIERALDGVGQVEAEDPHTFCSDPCAGLWFRAQPVKKATPPKKEKKAVAGSGEPFGLPYTCPECARGFERPQALGSHRQRAHGVAGQARSKGLT